MKGIEVYGIGYKAILRWLSLSLIPFTLYLLPGTLCAQFTVTPSVIGATCPSSSDGSISLVVSGGSAPYTYQWSPGGGTSASITGLMPRSYAVTITDNAGMDSSLSFTLGPSPIQDNVLLSCSIELHTTGGTAPYNYAWGDGSGASSLNAGRGSFSVAVTDANNCMAAFSYVIDTECSVAPDQFFTPNDDGYNDTWFITNAQYFDDVHMVVFNRWGIKIHEQKGTYQPWDGKSSFGVPVPVAVYYYFFYEYKGDKQKEAKAGSVTIMR